MIYEPSIYTALVREYLRNEFKAAALLSISNDPISRAYSQSVDRQYAYLKYDCGYGFFTDIRLEFGA